MREHFGVKETSKKIMLNEFVYMSITFKASCNLTFSWLTIWPNFGYIKSKQVYQEIFFFFFFFLLQGGKRWKEKKKKEKKKKKFFEEADEDF